ncbi:heterokaryon incompatibility protein-domain-containing protein [Scleroderma yunnanense]
MNMGEDCRTNVLEFRDDEATDYAILSHRWIGKEVDYKEMIKLAKMKEHDQKAVRDRDGYKKIVASCEQAQRDGYEWLWVDTCCIDKRSSVELSEAINSMYRWYANSKVCYAYLHDVTSTSLTKRSDYGVYPNSDGWPEWFSRGWTLQEMIAPSNVQFFNKDWQPIGDKRMLSSTLSWITRVPEHILTGGLSPNRPCIAQIMSWAARRKTTRVEDRAYSLLGLLNVNMPMLYGEGKKAFHRLQLEIIRVSNDQSIFAWGTDGAERTGSILADNPSFFEDCDEIELMEHNQLIEWVKNNISVEELHSIDEERFGVFPITNRGIQIWMLLCPSNDSDSVFKAWLPLTITLALWNSDYHRYHTPEQGSWKNLQLREVYLRYQDINRDITFEIDDNAITRNGFTCHSFPQQGRTFTFTSTGTDPLCVKAYSDHTGRSIAVGVGQCFGQDWILVSGKESTSEQPQEEFLQNIMKARGPELARSMAKECSQDGRNGRVWVKHFCLPGLTWTIRASSVVWETSLNRGVRIEVFRHPYGGPDKWIGIQVEGTNDPNRDMRGLMIPHEVRYPSILLVDGVSTLFSRAPNGIKLGDYGYFTDSQEFHQEGNISVVTPKRHKISDPYIGDTYMKYFYDHVELCEPLGLSVTINDDVNSWLDQHSTRLINRYLVTMVVQCATVPSSGDMGTDSCESISA